MLRLKGLGVRVSMTRPVGDDFGCKVRAETHPEGTLASFDLIARLMLLSSTS